MKNGMRANWVAFGFRLQLRERKAKLIMMQRRERNKIKLAQRVTKAM